MVQKERLVCKISYSRMAITKTHQETFYGKQVFLADRDMVETESDLILKNADKEDVSLLVVGDPFGQASRPIINPSMGV